MSRKELKRVKGERDHYKKVFNAHQQYTQLLNLPFHQPPPARIFTHTTHQTPQASQAQNPQYPVSTPLLIDQPHTPPRTNITPPVITTLSGQKPINAFFTPKSHALPQPPAALTPSLPLCRHPTEPGESVLPVENPTQEPPLLPTDGSQSRENRGDDMIEDLSECGLGVGDMQFGSEEL